MATLTPAGDLYSRERFINTSGAAAAGAVPPPRDQSALPGTFLSSGAARDFPARVPAPPPQEPQSHHLHHQPGGGRNAGGIGGGRHPTHPQGSFSPLDSLRGSLPSHERPYPGSALRSTSPACPWAVQWPLGHQGLCPRTQTPRSQEGNGKGVGAQNCSASRPQRLSEESTGSHPAHRGSSQTQPQVLQPKCS